jgi:type VI secretion system protein ImpJ
MTARPVHWHEGMFLRPHHFQAAQRYHAHHLAQATHWNLHHDWGLRAIEIDRDALRNNRLVISRLCARLRDGTLVSLPEDGVLPALDLKPHLERQGSVTVFLALPVVQLGRPNIAEDRQDSGRYRVDTLEAEDENTGVNPQLIQVRLLNLQLLLSTQDAAGFEVLPLARIEKSPRADALPQIDEAFIPPVLAIDAWEPLQVGILHSAFDRIGKKIDLLAEQITAQSIDFDSSAQGERLLFEQMRVLNEAQALLTILAFAEGMHPLSAYLELCRLVGALAIFGPARRTPNLQRYDHDDLGGCFHSAKHHLDDLLDAFVEPAYKERPFIGAGLRMQVALESLWLEPGWQLFIGVDSPLETEECVRLLTRPGGLDMKVGSSDRVDQLFRLGQAGLKFTHTPLRPAALPQRPGLIYFQVGRESQQAEWLNVQKSLSLAVRLNETRIAGKIQDQRRLTINTGGGQMTTLQFTLFAVPLVSGEGA